MLFSKECLAAQANDFINFILPKQATTTNPRQMVEGTIEQKSIKHLKLRVEPFINKKDLLPVESIITVRDGYFKEEVTLLPGLNLIYIETMSRSIYAVKPIFLLSADGKDSNPALDEWGRQAQIVFTHPATLRLTEYRTTLKGVVTDPKIKTVGIIYMNVVHFLGNSGDIKEKPIFYQDVPVKNMVFECAIDLSEGLNIILARPLGQKAGFEDIQVKSLLYEKTSKIIVLSEPSFNSSTRQITIKGTVSKPMKSVDIEIKTLVCELNNPYKIFPVVLVSERVPTAKNGDFSISTSLKGNKYIIKSPPIVSIIARGDRASKTLLKW